MTARPRAALHRAPPLRFGAPLAKSGSMVVVRRICTGDRARSISRDCHESLAEIIADTTSRLRETIALNCICLTGGSFQNTMPLDRSLDRLAKADSRVLALTGSHE